MLNLIYMLRYSYIEAENNTLFEFCKTGKASQLFVIGTLSLILLMLVVTISLLLPLMLFIRLYLLFSLVILLLPKQNDECITLDVFSSTPFFSYPDTNEN